MVRLWVPITVISRDGFVMAAGIGGPSNDWVGQRPPPDQQTGPTGLLKIRRTARGWPFRGDTGPARGWRVAGLLSVTP
ncbi:hypothetical protein GCM10022222_52120 [Amycolatopsis ultiminotia]|uniref:Uncharacterized protein n=1 Tax=Amycolatopsis ultiminotia TaxID=543629 RepID=A0ABP6X5V4_9PSEU